ncbi:MAG: histidine phosphatase family protein [Chloroflexi bacterium]|nr:histidine phosphatase family protein [Chloroflexota bacterium]
MRLHFFRHAIAEEARDGKSDHQRELTSEGIERTRTAARVLKQLRFEPDHLFSSPLVRARQTADILAEGLGVAVQVRPEVGPGFNVDAITRLTHNLGDADVLFVGHEPDFSNTIYAITGGRVLMKKGCLVSVEVDPGPSLRGSLSTIIPPKVFSRLI